MIQRCSSSTVNKDLSRVGWGSTSGACFVLFIGSNGNNPVDEFDPGKDSLSRYCKPENGTPPFVESFAPNVSYTGHRTLPKLFRRRNLELY